MLPINQFGFRAEDQLLMTYGEVVELVDGGFVILNLSKDFDVVKHSTILTKLQMLFIGGELLSWICEGLSGQTMSRDCRQNEWSQTGY